MYTLEELKDNRDLWRSTEAVAAICDWCKKSFEAKYGTLYNVIRRNADGIYCCRKCAGAARAEATQKKYAKDGGKTCKRCGEFKKLNNFSSLPNPPFLRSECKRCHNYKPARQYNLYKDKAERAKQSFELSMDQFLKFYNKPCYYCDAQVKRVRLELLDTSKGFSTNNIVSCCRRCQKFKNGMSHQAFIEICRTISEKSVEEQI